MTSERVSSCFFASLSRSETTLSGKRTFIISMLASPCVTVVVGFMSLLFMSRIKSENQACNKWVFWLFSGNQLVERHFP